MLTGFSDYNNYCNQSVVLTSALAFGVGVAVDWGLTRVRRLTLVFPITCCNVVSAH